MKQIYLLTGNADKITAANLIFGQYKIEVLPLGLNIPEIQASSSAEVARYMAEQAYKLTGKPVIREDHSFYIKELGFPGPFMAYVDKTISGEQLIKIVDTLKSRDAYFELAACYVDEGGTAHEFSYTVPVEITTELRGDETQLWERAIKLKGEDRVFAEYLSSERTDLWSKNYQSIAELMGAS